MHLTGLPLPIHPLPGARDSSPGLAELAQKDEAWVGAQPGRPWLDPWFCAWEAVPRDPENVRQLQGQAPAGLPLCSMIPTKPQNRPTMEMLS